VCPFECAALASRTHRTAENRRRRRPPQKRYFTLILGKTRVQNNQTGTHKLHAVLHQQRELRCPTLLLSPCYLCYSAIRFHYYMPTLLSPIIETVCPFECAALASRTHRTVVSRKTIEPVLINCMQFCTNNENPNQVKVLLLLTFYIHTK
jgi:hypothetical protein